MKNLKEIIESNLNESARPYFMDNLRSIDDITDYIVETLYVEDVLSDILSAVMDNKVRGVRHPGEMLDDDKFKKSLFSKLSDKMIKVMDDEF
jgi:hypothetical protein